MRRTIVALLGTGLLLAAPIALTTAQGAPDAQMRAVPAPRVVLKPGPPLAEPVASGVLPAGEQAKLRSSAAATSSFVVTYRDGFLTNADARAAFQRAVDVWARRITSTVPIRIEASFRNLGDTRVLGAAGPSLLLIDFDGAPEEEVYYADAVADKLAGRQLVEGEPEIYADFNSINPSWHFGAGGAPPGKYDFTTTVLHELGHGLGFLGFGTYTGGTGTVRDQGIPTSYDLVTRQGASGPRLLTYRDGSTELGSAMVSNDVWIDTRQIRTVNGGQPARLYAPSGWQEGSSYSHFDENSFARGTPNALMTPLLSPAETIREPGNLTMAVLKAVGW